MLPEIKSYLDQVRHHLHLDPLTERQVVGELCTHFEEEVGELRQRFPSERQAALAAIDSFGRARVVARLLYEAYSKGSWTDAALAALPHLSMALLFASHLWRHPFFASAIFIGIVATTLFGWWHSKPNWLYSWIGYSLIPLLIGAYAASPVFKQALLDLMRGERIEPSIWLIILILASAGLFIWILVSTSIRVIKRDWILASLMLVPLPIFGSWLFNIDQLGGLFQSGSLPLHQWDSTMALAFAVLGATSAAFIRLRQRTLKIGAVIIVGTIALAMVANNLSGGLGFFGLLALFVLMPAFLLTPALVEARIGHGEPADAWWHITSPTSRP